MSASATELVEEWKPIVGFPGYEVSDQGRVRSYFLKVRSSHRRGFVIGAMSPTPRILKASNLINGHLQVGMMTADGMTSQKVHRLVLNAFVGPCPDGFECRHLNGNPKDNRLLNLAWGTHSENMHDRAKHGRWTKQKLSIDDIPEIRSLLSDGVSCSEIADMFEASTGAINDIKSGRSWAWL